MGAVNYRTSEYITMGYNCNAEMPRDDFWTTEEEQKEFEVSFLYDEITDTLKKYDFQYYHVAIVPGYYEGFSIEIENNFPVCLDSWQDRREMHKEITQVKRFLLECLDLGLVQCFPGWCTGYSTPTETLAAIKEAVKAMRDELNGTPTALQYEKGA